MFHGDVLAALDFNAMIPVVSIFFGYIVFSMLSVAVRGKGFSINKTSIGIVWVTLVMLLAFGVLRNIPAYPFTVLFP